jgi:hypothetical protein
MNRRSVSLLAAKLDGRGVPGAPGRVEERARRRVHGVTSGLQGADLLARKKRAGLRRAPGLSCWQEISGLSVLRGVVKRKNAPESLPARSGVP